MRLLVKRFKGDILQSEGKPFLLFIYLFFTRHFEFFLVLILKYRLLLGKEDKERIHERKGMTKLKRPDGQLIWFNAASIGEVLSVFQLIKLLREKDKKLNFLITSTTLTSSRIIQKIIPKNCQHQFSPIDTYRATKSFLYHWKPDLAIFVESEFWPRLLLETKAQNIPLGLINARMENRSFENWKKVNQTAKSIIETFNFAFAQDEVTAKRLLSLGMRKEVLLGIFSLKEQAQPLSFDENELNKLKANFLGRKIWVAASTHLGEEEILVRAQKKLYDNDKKYLLILVPRHPERGEIIARNLTSMGEKISIRSKNQKVRFETEIYLADTIGELGLWYKLSDIAFIGGSMVNVGGHNPYEPCRFGTALLHGSFVYNFQSIFDLLHSKGASIIVKDSDSLFQEIRNLNRDKKAHKIGLKGMKLVNSLTDKSKPILKAIHSFI